MTNWPPRSTVHGPRSTLTPCITAGGRSSRFGTDKALARLGGETLLERVALSLEGALEGVLEEGSARFLVAPEGKYALRGWVVLPDTRPGEGPLAGLEVALTHAAPGWVAFAGVDLPLLTPGYWQALLDARAPAYARGHLAVQALDPSGRPGPLAALYHTDLLPHVTALLDSGERRLRLAAPPHLRTLVPGLDGRFFTNVNTPGDLPPE